MKVLVLSGGGSHGAWQAGAIKALAERHSYDAIIGTSVGAVNAYGLSTQGPEGLFSLWRDIKGFSSIMALNWEWPWNWDGVFNFGPLERLIVARGSGQSLKVPVYVAAMDLEDLQVNHISMTGNAEMDAKYISGSCAVAGIQSPSMGLVDGGHKEIAPVRFAIEGLGATEVHVVLSDPIKETRPGWPPWRYFPILSIMIRALSGMIDEISRTDIAEYRTELTVYAPSHDHDFGSLDYSPDTISKALDGGYKETKLRLTA